MAIVIVNFRTPRLTVNCLRSLASERGRGVDFVVYVGDAESGDGSLEAISDFINDHKIDWATCFPIGRNGGFAYGNNHILREHALRDPAVTHIHFLNPDTYIHDGAVHYLLQILTEDPRVGAAGSLLENPDGTPRSCAFRFPNPWREFFRGASFSVLDRLVPTAQVVVPPSGKVEPVDWVSGASFMVSREALEAVGLLDEQFFLYFEETDFMARLSDAGFRVMHVPSSRVVHLAGQATGYRASDVPRRLSPHWLQSRAHFFVKHHGRLGLVLGTVLFLSGDMFRRVRHALGLRPKTSPPHLWRDYLRFGFSSEGGVGHGPAVR